MGTASLIKNGRPTMRVDHVTAHWRVVPGAYARTRTRLPAKAEPIEQQAMVVNLAEGPDDALAEAIARVYR